MAEDTKGTLESRLASVPSSEVVNYGTLARYDEQTIRGALEQRFRYKPWDTEQIERGKHVTDAFIKVAFTVIANVPPCPTRTRVLNEIEQCRMLANAAITHEGSF